jgi:hypothetical protein
VLVPSRFAVGKMNLSFGLDSSWSWTRKRRVSDMLVVWSGLRGLLCFLVRLIIVGLLKLAFRHRATHHLLRQDMGSLTTLYLRR